MKSRNVTIMLTNTCNLNCIYCYESNKVTSDITKETALAIIDKEMSMEDDYDCIEFNLFGGEPFLRFELIEKIYDFLEEKAYKKNWRIGLITNGTVMNKEIKSWLIKHRNNITCTLSIDGTKTMQDRNRNNSFDLLDLDFFINTFEIPYAKMTISEYTVNGLCEGALFLQGKGFYVNASIAYGTKATDYFINSLSEQLDQYYEKMKGMEYSDRCSLLRFPYETIFMGKGKYFRTCDAGKIARAYDVDGKKYPCYMFLPVSLSDIQIEGMKKIVFPEIEVDKKELSNECRVCSIYSVCHNCYCNNYKVNGNIYDVDKSICKINKMIVGKQAEFFAWLWENNKLILSEKEEKMLIDSLLFVLK